MDNIGIDLDSIKTLLTTTVAQSRSRSWPHSRSG